MAERSYFSLRWAIPGYTFLLLFIAINHRAILFTLQTTPKIPEFFELFSAFLLALSGSAVGFLISQSWFFWYRWRDVIYEAPKREITTLSKIYKLVKNPTKEQKEIIVVAQSYILNIMAKKYEGLVEYLNRRYDLFNIFGSSMHSVFWGLILGWSVRIIAVSFLNKPFDFPPNINMIRVTEFWVLFLTSIFGIVVFFLLRKARDQVMRQYDLVAQAVIKMAHRSGIEEVKPDRLKYLFSCDIFLNDDKNS